MSRCVSLNPWAKWSVFTLRVLAASEVQDHLCFQMLLFLAASEVSTTRVGRVISLSNSSVCLSCSALLMADAGRYFNGFTHQLCPDMAAAYYDSCNFYSKAHITQMVTTVWWWR